MSEVLMSAKELAAVGASEPIVIIDTRNPAAFAAGHIPGAVNIHEIFTYLATSTPEGIAELKTTFAASFGAAGLSGEETAVVYEQSMNSGFGMSCRGYYLLSMLGYPKIKVLHGGYEAWCAAELPFAVPAIENINGQAITLAMKHKDKRNPKDWKGFRLAIPFDYSIHNYLLRYYLAENGIDPDTDVQLRSVPPPEMVANLRADNIDGFLAPDNIAQRAVYDGVGFIHMLSKEIWDGHPCCSFSASRAFIAESPNSYAALLRAILDATAYASKAENRKEIAEAIAPANYLNAPVTVLEQVLTGTYADGLGGVKKDPARITFDPFPYESFAVWMMTQMKRWGQIKGDIDYAGVAKQIFLATDAAKAMKDAGLTPPAAPSKSFVVMGKTFDPTKPDDYVNSFAMKRG